MERLEGSLAGLRGAAIFTTDMSKLTASDKVAAVTTAVSQATVVSTAAPRPRHPLRRQFNRSPEALNKYLYLHPRKPILLPARLWSEDVAAILTILGIAAWQACRGQPDTYKEVHSRIAKLVIASATVRATMQMVMGHTTTAIPTGGDLLDKDESTGDNNDDGIPNYLDSDSNFNLPLKNTLLPIILK